MNDELERGRILQAPHLAAQAAVYRERRERIATAALQGILLDPERRGSPKDFAKYALQYADALIAELDKEVKP